VEAGAVPRRVRLTNPSGAAMTPDGGTGSTANLDPRGMRLAAKCYQTTRSVAAMVAVGLRPPGDPVSSEEVLVGYSPEG